MDKPLEIRRRQSGDEGREADGAARLARRLLLPEHTDCRHDVCRARRVPAAENVDEIRIAVRDGHRFPLEPGPAERQKSAAQKTGCEFLTARGRIVGTREHLRREEIKVEFRDGPRLPIELDRQRIDDLSADIDDLAPREPERPAHNRGSCDICHRRRGEAGTLDPELGSRIARERDHLFIAGPARRGGQRNGRSCAADRQETILQTERNGEHTVGRAELESLRREL